MTDREEQNAGRALIVQDDQTGRLGRRVRDLDRHMDELQQEAAEQGTRLDDLEGKMEEFWKEAGPTPPPFLSALQKLSVDSGFTLREGGDPVSVPNLIRYMYSNGYDLRHFATMAIVPSFAELAVRIHHYVRTAAQSEVFGKDSIRDRLKLSQMLILTHSLLASCNIVKTALYGWNPTALNYAQFLALGKQMISLVKLSSERNALIQEDLAKGWEALLAEGESLARSTRVRAATG